MRLSSEEKQVRRDYRRNLFERTPLPKLFPLPRVIVTLLLSGSQFGFASIRHKWNPKAPQPQLAKEMWIFFAIVIVLYLVMYGLEWSWNYVILAPMVLDKDNKAQLKTRIGEISELQTKIQSLDTTRQEKEARIKRNFIFAQLMDEGQEVWNAFATAPEANEFNKVHNKLADWIRRTVAALREAHLYTDAAAFSHIGSINPPTELMASLASHSWRKGTLAIVAMYRNKLNEIVSVREI